MVTHGASASGQNPAYKPAHHRPPGEAAPWKDDDEFEQILKRRIFEQATGERVRAEASGVIHRLETNASPFNEGWEGWRPDPSWAVPRLQPGWDDASL